MSLEGSLPNHLGTAIRGGLIVKNYICLRTTFSDSYDSLSALLSMGKYKLICVICDLCDMYVFKQIVTNRIVSGQQLDIATNHRYVTVNG
jgi:hypothetical protein